MPMLATSSAIGTGPSQPRGKCVWHTRAGCPDHDVEVLEYPQHNLILFTWETALPPCFSTHKTTPRVVTTPSGVDHCCTPTSTRPELRSTARSTTNILVSDVENVAFSMHAGILQVHHTTPLSQEIETTSRRTLAGARLCWRRRRTTSRWYMGRSQLVQKRPRTESTHSMVRVPKMRHAISLKD